MSPVRTALLSDIHGNAVALAALVADLAVRPVDEVVCLGDVAQGGAQPVEVIDRLVELGWPVVLGNADAFLLDPDAGAEPATERLLAVRQWSVARLGPERLERIRSFSATVETSLAGGRRLLAFHGSPSSYDDIILPATEEERFRALLGETEATVLAGGHVHVPFVRRSRDRLFVNPGSVGLGYDHEQPPDDFRFDAWACYAVVTTEDDDRLEVALRRVPFEWEEVVRAIRASGIPHGEDPARRWTPRSLAPEPVGAPPR